MIKIENKRFARGSAFSSLERQQMLMSATVLIAGCGGEGGPVAINLARLGVGKFILADPGNIHAGDINRYPHATISTIGKNKSEVIAAIIKDVDPEIEVEVISDGITPENVEQLIKKADVIQDGIDIYKPALSELLHQTARRHNKPVAMSIAIGRGGVATVFNPNSKYHFEQFIKNTESIPHIPYYENVIAVFNAFNNGMPAPTTTVGTPIATAMVTDLIERLIAPAKGRNKVTFAPHYIVCDIGGKCIKAKTVKHPKIHLAICFLKAFIYRKLDFIPEIGGYGDMEDV